MLMRVMRESLCLCHAVTLSPVLTPEGIIGGGVEFHSRRVAGVLRVSSLARPQTVHDEWPKEGPSSP